MNDIAVCLSGNNTHGYFMGGSTCSGWTTRIAMVWDFNGHTYNPVRPTTNTLTPPGCNPFNTHSPPYCSGWITETTFGPNTFTQANCNPCSITRVDAESTADGFDDISTSISASPGDSLLVSIQFTVS